MFCLFKYINKMAGNPGMAGFYKEFMAALHADLGRGDVNQRLRFFGKKKGDTVCFFWLHLTFNKW
jgi:hypothetical protein